ncbi:MAG: hypothetical protein ACKVH8_14215 [Pirellulales bacterium]
MFSRTILLTLITALIACPLWCASGVAACCGENLVGFQASLNQVAENVCKNCCCEQPTQSTHNDSPQDGSSNSGKPCQGICGGAVVEKPIEFNDANYTTVLQLDTLNWVSVDRSTSTAISTECQLGLISGRLLRTLHMSFLC